MCQRLLKGSGAQVRRAIVELLHLGVEAAREGIERRSDVLVGSAIRYALPGAGGMEVPGDGIVRRLGKPFAVDLRGLLQLADHRIGHAQHLSGRLVSRLQRHRST